jgi:hypothetical protein
MKKLIFSAIALIAFTNLNAQEKSFGAKAGLNIAKLTQTNQNISESTDSKIGFHVGFFGEFKIAKQFAIQPEVLFSRVGGDVKEQSGSGGFSLNYISIPVMFKYYPTKEFSLEAGPQISFLTGASVTYGNQTVDADQIFNAFDFGLNIGMNYNFTDKVFANARYNFGLSNIASDTYINAINEYDNSNSSSIKFNNSYFQLGLGFKF